MSPIAARSSVSDSAAWREVSDTSRLAEESTPACWAAASMLASCSIRRAGRGRGTGPGSTAGTAAVRPVPAAAPDGAAFR